MKLPFKIFMEQILQILSSKVTMVRSDNSVNRECLWLDLPMDHRKMLYNHCASGILEASKKDPALTDLRFLQLSAGHSQTNLSGVFCLSFKTICVLHAHSRRDASKLPSNYISNANSTPDVFYDLTDTLPWWKATAQDLPCWATAVQKMVLFQPSSAAAKRVFSLLVTMFGDQQHEGLEDYLEAAFMLRIKSR